MSLANIDIKRKVLCFRIATIVVFLFAGYAVFISCGNTSNNNIEGRLITDSSGRKVVIPDTVGSVIALKSGAMRLLSYMELTHLVSHIEGSEQRRTVPYLFANPHLRDLPVIGVGNNYDTELLTAAHSDIIVATYMTSFEADRLQRITLTPVVLLDYGNLGDEIDNLFGSISLLGEIFHRSDRSDTLVKYISGTLEECRMRALRTTEISERVYIGGVAYSGSHGITSTEPDYPPFKVLSIQHIAEGKVREEKRNALSHEVLFIDSEQLIEWNPEIIFLDVAGSQIWKGEIAQDVMRSSLSALGSGRVYTLLPYNWNSTNYENLLCNVWYIGSVLMPSAFGDIDYSTKSREIYNFIYGRDIWDEVESYYMPFKHLKNDKTE